MLLDYIQLYVAKQRHYIDLERRTSKTLIIKNPFLSKASLRKLIIPKFIVFAFNSRCKWAEKKNKSPQKIDFFYIMFYLNVFWITKNLENMFIFIFFFFFLFQDIVVKIRETAAFFFKSIVITWTKSVEKCWFFQKINKTFSRTMNLYIFWLFCKFYNTYWFYRH